MASWQGKLIKGGEKAHIGKTSDFVFLIGRALERTIYLYLESIPQIKTNFMSLKEAAQVSPYSEDYLNVMVRRGVIPAFKLKRNWLITKEALERYVKNTNKTD